MQLLPNWMLQTALVTQFYLYGRKHFTATGWLAASSSYPTPDALTAADLSEKVYIVTGATSGVGKKVNPCYLHMEGGGTRRCLRWRR